MKKISYDKWLRNKIAQQKLHRLAIKKSNYRKTRANKNCPNKHNKFKLVALPEKLSLAHTHPRCEVLHTLKKIESYLEQGFNVHICFKQAKLLRPCGTLWLVATCEHLMHRYPGKLKGNRPLNNTVEQLFQHIGLLQKLGVPDRNIPINAENVKFWHYFSGLTTDDVSQFKQLFESITLSESIQSGLFDSLSEAVTNTIHHAYPGQHRKQWYMFTQYKDGKFTIAICDLGISIPKSLQKKTEVKQFVKLLKNKRDNHLLEIAVQSNRTRTKLPYRGKGLKEMLEQVRQGTVGGFRILSARGAFNYNAENKSETGRDFKKPIKGTIIEWQIPLKSDYE